MTCEWSYLSNIVIFTICNISWVILLDLIHTRNLQLLAIFYNLAANKHEFCPKLVKYV